MEVEDDVFFADLSKQITLLIMDDDEDSVARCPSVSLQTFSQECQLIAPPPLLYKQTWRRGSNGTGVFIPRSSFLPRRKNRQGKFTSFNTKSYNQPDRSRGVSNVAYTTDSSCNCHNSRKG